MLFLPPCSAGEQLLADHQPVGANRPLQKGDRFKLLPARLYESASFSAPHTYLARARQVELLGASNDFYYLSLGADSLYYVYRSELGVQDLQDVVTKESDRYTDETDTAVLSVSFDSDRPPAPGERLALANFLLYSTPDLLAEHSMVSGVDSLTVELAENASGFLRVSTDKGEEGWLYRGDLPEKRRLW